MLLNDNANLIFLRPLQLVHNQRERDRHAGPAPFVLLRIDKLDYNCHALAHVKLAILNFDSENLQ